VDWSLETSIKIARIGHGGRFLSIHETSIKIATTNL
jgi:hypothetical protein